MKLVLFLLLLFQINYSLGYSINLEGVASLNDCSSTRDEKFFYCKGADGSVYLIKESRWSYSAVRKLPNGKLNSLKVNEIYHKNGEELFVADFSRSSLFRQEQRPEFVGDLARYTDDLRSVHNDFFSSDEYALIDGDHNEIKELALSIKNEIDSKHEFFENALSHKNLQLELENGDKLTCTRDETLKQCSLLDCGKDSYGNDVILIRNKNVYTSNFETFFLRNGKIAKDHDNVTKLLSHSSQLLLEKNGQVENKSTFTKGMLVPAKYKNSPELYEKLLDSSYKKFLENQAANCGDNTKKLFSDLIDQALDDKVNAQMVQLIDLANGNLESNYVNKESLPDYACIYNGVYYSPEGHTIARNIERMSKKTISIDRAKELFNKAKARKDIAWNYTFDGCYARAHLMARMFEEEGVHVDKAWLRGSLQIPSGTPQQTWGYHVAPLVHIENDDGSVVEMIIDPSVAQGPIGPSEWAAMMKVDLNQSDKVSYPTPINTKKYSGSSYTVTNSVPYWPDLDLSLTEEMKTKKAVETMEQYTSGLDHWGQEFEQW
ncbi:protein-glutamine glutaminase family protein [Halobacteriovorax sp. HLS]|uniref:protein-glutamine glutaminase family protein n=1 Tax=Halobacteriovorax sp. HLS TaxID=2234000 RepID=UPI000FDA8BF7|nr:protein-glutamine glutaminase family protein [Halobacteriovorax sp. HLS]